MTQEHSISGISVIEQFGKAHRIEGAVHVPDACATYQIVFSVSAPGKKPEAPHAGLERVARNLGTGRQADQRKRESRQAFPGCTRGGAHEPRYSQRDHYARRSGNLA